MPILKEEVSFLINKPQCQQSNLKTHERIKVNYL